MEIVLATSNKGKIQELQSLLSPLVCHSQEEFGIDSPAETGLSFIENALIKARYTSQLSNRPALADDSGLVVPLLQGEPGIYSARYAGEKSTDEENINKLLQILKRTGQQQVEAYFYCAVSFLQHANDPTPLISCGKITGKIVMEPRGSNGFGYDPIFYIPEQGCTAAELRPSLKNEISHRAQAIKSLCSQLKELF